MYVIMFCSRYVPKYLVYIADIARALEPGESANGGHYYFQKGN